MRAAFTDAPHLSLFIVVPVLLGFATAFLALGLHNFRRRVLS
jgi:ABC-2 type transport system permease protein